MANRAATLAEQLEQVNHEVIDLVEQLTEDDWQVVIPGDGRTVGVVVQHIAVGYTAEVELLHAMIGGVSIPEAYTSRAGLNAMNADSAVELAGGTKEDGVRLLREHGAAAADYIRSLSDADLDRRAVVGLFGNQPITVEWLISRVVLHHPHMHLPDIRAAFEAMEA